MTSPDPRPHVYIVLVADPHHRYHWIDLSVATPRRGSRTALVPLCTPDTPLTQWTPVRHPTAPERACPACATALRMLGTTHRIHPVVPAARDPGPLVRQPATPRIDLGRTLTALLHRDGREWSAQAIRGWLVQQEQVVPLLKIIAACRLRAKRGLFTEQENAIGETVWKAA